METNREINPIINAALVMIGKVAGVESVELLSTEMYRLEPTEDAPAGQLGVDIIINDALSGKFKTFLGYEICEDMIAYPNGMFITQEFIHLIVSPKDPTRLFENPDPDYKFDVLKNIGEDGVMHLPPHTGNTETKIDVFPGAADFKDGSDEHMRSDKNVVLPVPKQKRDYEHGNKNL